MSESEAQVCQNTFLWVLICLLHSLGLFLNSCTTESAAFLLRDVMKGQKMKLKRWQVITHTVEENSFQKWQFKYTQRCRKIFFPYLNNMVPFYMVTYFHPSKNKEIPTCQKQIIAAVRAFCLWCLHIRCTQHSNARPRLNLPHSCDLHWSRKIACWKGELRMCFLYTTPSILLSNSDLMMVMNIPL